MSNEDSTHTTEFVPDVPEGWEVYSEIEGGQPNGSGVIEESNYREWFRPERETHHRQTITLYGPWVEGASPEGLRAQEYRRQERERTELAEREEYERLHAKYAPEQRSWDDITNGDKA